MSTGQVPPIGGTPIVTPETVKQFLKALRDAIDELLRQWDKQPPQPPPPPPPPPPPGPIIVGPGPVSGDHVTVTGTVAPGFPVVSSADRSPEDPEDPEDPAADRAILDRHIPDLGPCVREMARHAMVDLPTDRDLARYLDLPQARAVLALIERGMERGLDDRGREPIQKQGNTLLRQWVALNLGFVAYLRGRIQQAGLEVDPFVLGYHDALEHLLRRFRQ